VLDEAFHCVCSETSNCFEHTLNTCFQDKYPIYLKYLPLNATLNHLILNKPLGLKCTPIRFWFTENKKCVQFALYYWHSRKKCFQSSKLLRFPVTQEFKPLADYESRLNIYFCSLKNESIVRVFRHTFWKCDKTPSCIIFFKSTFLNELFWIPIFSQDIASIIKIGCIFV